VKSAGEVFGQRMKEIRQKRGLTQVELSQRSGFTQARVSELEHGSRMPNLVTILRIAAALDCKVAELMSIFDEEGLSYLLPK
jgi:transcriptional regulator with XRE-family HTH domain